MRVLCIFIVTILLSSACRDKVICPAFQSTYILDDSTRMAYYSYAWQLDDITRQQYIASLTGVDTSATGGVGDAPGGDFGEYFAYVEDYVPPAAKVRKTKYGIVKYEPYWLKTLRMKTAPMENVLGPEDVIEEPIDEGEFYVSDFVSDDSLGLALSADSLALGTDSLAFTSDSLAVAQAETAPQKPEQKYRFRYDPKDNFNVEQDYYNKYFGVLLLDLTPPPSEAPVDSLASAEVLPDSLATGKGFMAGLKGLFKKKDKPASEEETEEAPLEETPLEEDPQGTEEEGQEEEGGGGG